jgi:hypothetical protein
MLLNIMDCLFQRECDGWTKEDSFEENLAALLRDIMGIEPQN